MSEYIASQYDLTSPHSVVTTKTRDHNNVEKQNNTCVAMSEQAHVIDIIKT